MTAVWRAWARSKACCCAVAAACLASTASLSAAAKDSAATALLFLICTSTADKRQIQVCWSNAVYRHVIHSTYIAAVKCEQTANMACAQSYEFNQLMEFSKLLAQLKGMQLHC